MKYFQCLWFSEFDNKLCTVILLWHKKLNDIKIREMLLVLQCQVYTGIG